MTFVTVAYGKHCKVTGSFAHPITGDPWDPETVTLSVEDPGRTSTVYAYADDDAAVQIQRIETGSYLAFVPLGYEADDVPTGGDWYLEWGTSDSTVDDNSVTSGNPHYFVREQAPRAVDLAS